MMKVERKPHPANIKNGEQTFFAQDRVFVDGVLAGYIGHHAEAALCLIRRFEPEQIAEIEAQLGGDLGKTVQVPRMTKDATKTEEDGLDALDLDT